MHFILSLKHTISPFIKVKAVNILWKKLNKKYLVGMYFTTAFLQGKVWKSLMSKYQLIKLIEKFSPSQMNPFFKSFVCLWTDMRISSIYFPCNIFKKNTINSLFHPITFSHVQTQKSGVCGDTFRKLAGDLVLSPGREDIEVRKGADGVTASPPLAHIHRLRDKSFVIRGKFYTGFLG